MHSWQIIVSQFTMAPRRDSSAMTRPTSGVVSQAGDPSKIEEDKSEIRDYVKEVLFEKVVFVWNKGALQPGGVLHKDYLMNCRAKIAGSRLMNATDSKAEMYMNLLWTMMVKDVIENGLAIDNRQNTRQCRISLQVSPPDG
jgi:hypothetical protein